MKLISKKIEKIKTFFEQVFLLGVKLQQEVRSILLE